MDYVPAGQAGTQDQENIQPSEIEITPEMIEAGVSVFREWVESDADEMAVQEMPSYASLSGLASSLFSAMMASYP